MIALTLSAVSQADDNRDLDLLDAIKANDTKLAKTIIDSGLDLDYEINGSPLILAIKSKNIELIEYLLLKGADPEYQGYFYYLPLHLAIYMKSNEAVEQLLKYDIDLNGRITGAIGNTALILAAEFGDIALFKMLLDAGADIAKTDNYKDQALAFAAFHGQLEMVKYIVSLKVDITHKNVNGLTAFDHATRANHEDIAEYLGAL